MICVVIKIKQDKMKQKLLSNCPSINKNEEHTLEGTYCESIAVY